MVLQRYQTTLIAACGWSFLESALCLLSWPIIKGIFGLVLNVRYIKLPISYWYIQRLASLLLSGSDILIVKLTFIGMTLVLHSVKLTLMTKSQINAD